MYTLYGIDESGSCMIEIALHRCAVPWRRVDAASWADGEGSDELARINPLKQVPTLVTPDGQVLTESAAILIHLAWRFPMRICWAATVIRSSAAWCTSRPIVIRRSASSTTRNAGWATSMKRCRRN